MSSAPEPIEPIEPIRPAPSTDVVALQARVAELEAEVAALRTDTATTVAKAQATLFWFERWHVDWDRVMARREAEWAGNGFRALRKLVRTAKKIKHRLLG